ncbi:MAG: hypothetical protein U9Q03_00580 [Patescibacteria group bacterium]|nr:hypothetical protein [Patescibacteria group bacterium]
MDFVWFLIVMVAVAIAVAVLITTVVSHGAKWILRKHGTNDEPVSVDVDKESLADEADTERDNPDKKKD